MTQATTDADAISASDPEDVDLGIDAPRATRTSIATVARDAVVIVVLTLMPLAVLYKFWEGEFRIPLIYDGDGLFYGGITQNLIEGGWVQTSERLGAPFGQELYDFPTGADNLNWLVLRILTLGSSDWALATNAFYFLTFPAASLSAFFAIRWLGASRITAGVAAILFAFAPYHLWRNTGHLPLSSYAAIPIGVVLAVRVGRGKSPVWEWRRRGRSTWPLTLGWLACAVIVASTGSYYATFGLISIAVAACFAGAAQRDWRPLLAGAATGGIIVAIFAVNLAPSLLYSREHGDNPLVGERHVFEVDVYGLRVAQLFTPVPDHRVGPLRDLSADLMNGPYNSETSQMLGLTASIGLLGMLGVTLVRAVRIRPPKEPAPDDTKPEGIDERSLLAVLALAAILVGTTGGLSWFLAVAGAEEIRNWNRISIHIMFLALAWLALTLTRPIEARTRTRGAQAVAAVLALGVITLGILDQTPRSGVPDRDLFTEDFHADRAFFTRVEDAMPEGASIFQLPYIPFPETPPVVASGDYDLLRPYLNTEKLRWSYGGMKGRETEWQSVAVGQPVDQMVDDIVAAGFSGILVDRHAYEDLGAAIAAELTNASGVTPEASENGRWLFFDLAPVVGEYEASSSEAEREARREEVLAKRP